jgi:hypothetical protein
MSEFMLIFLNSFIRIRYPSSYCPLLMETDNSISNPLVARTLATVAEFIFYYRETLALGIEFYGSKFFYITLLGECICWCHLLTQSELLGFCEDFICTIFQLNALVETTRLDFKCIFTGYIIYMVFIHLPSIFTRIKPPYFNRIHLFRPMIGRIDHVVRQWQILSLLSKPILFCYFYIKK